MNTVTVQITVPRNDQAMIAQKTALELLPLDQGNLTPLGLSLPPGNDTTALVGPDLVRTMIWVEDEDHTFRKMFTSEKARISVFQSLFLGRVSTLGTRGQQTVVFSPPLARAERTAERTALARAERTAERTA